MAKKKINVPKASKVKKESLLTEDFENISFPIVGIGASAGGLEALESFFKKMPEGTGMAFVVVQHLSPDYKSLMSELLARITLIPIFRVEDGMMVKPDNIYLIPPKKNMTIFGGRLYLTDHSHGMGLNLPIDIFFRSLAQDQGKNAIGVILSGTGSDGALGIKAIKESGGTVLVQDDKSAKFDGMPRSSIATGMVDCILPPDEMPEKLISYIKHPLITKSKEDGLNAVDDSALLRILKIIRDRIGVDFTYYKPNTIVRRIEKRLGINQIADFQQYLDFLTLVPGEVNILYNDLLIGVTQFFRDTDAYELLNEKLIPEILAGKKSGDTVRIWTVGCSTGEEAYSIAMLLSEYMEKNGVEFDVKLFATDIDKESIELAGNGTYPESIITDVSPERLYKFFEKKNGGYHVKERLRRMVIYAQQNIIKDPPFSKLDMISCRNMLIYLNQDMQRKIISMFYYSLNNGGGLFLGSSESLGDMTDGFDVINSKWKLYRQKMGFRPPMQTNYLLPLTVRPKTFPRMQEPAFQSFSDKSLPEKVLPDNILTDLLEKIMPASVIVNESFNIIHVFRDVNDFVKIPTGKARFDILSMVRKEMAVVLSSMLHKVLKENKEVYFKDIKLKDENKLVSISAKPLNDKFSNKRFVVISFENVSVVKNEDTNEIPEKFDLNSQLSERYIEIEKELQFTKENLQATIEELETSNEELQSTNEELVSSNEELQSTNEELQSVNEELYTVNSEYQKKIEELTLLNNDMNNLLKNTNIGILYLDRSLKIRKYTNMITRVINVMEMDVLRPIYHISLNVNYKNFISDIEEVKDTLKSKEIELLDAEGNWNLIRIMPYRTMENAIDGITITVIDISKLKQSEQKTNALGEKLELALSMGNLALWDWDYPSGHVKFTDQKAYMLGYEPIDIRNNKVYDWTALVHPDDYDSMMKKMKDHLEGKTPFYEAEYRIKAKSGKWIWFYDKGGVVSRDENNKPVRITGIVYNLSSVKESESKYKYLFDSMLQGVVYQNAEGRIIAANPAAEELLGLTSKQIIGRDSVDPRWKTIHEDGSDFPGLSHPSMLSLASGKEINNTIMGVFDPKQNKHKWISINAIPQFREGEKKAYQVFSTFEDITEKKEQENEIIRNNKLLYRIFDNSPVGKLVLDKNGHFTYANKHAEEILSIKPNDVEKRTYNDLKWNILDTEGKDIPDENLPFRLVLNQKKELRNYYLSIATETGTLKHLCINGAPMFDENNEVEGVVFSIEEIAVDELKNKKGRRNL
jgi:two-component system CheB/CheR fusion protein